MRTTSKRAAIKKRILPFKKRNIIAITLAIFITVLLVRGYITQAQEKPQAIGTLVLPGSGELSYEFTMPVSGSFRIALQAINDGSIDVVAGSTFDRSTCEIDKPAREFPLKELKGNPDNFTGFTSTVIHHGARTKCVSFGRFGVIRVEVRNITDNVSVETQYNPSSDSRSPSKSGTEIAGFGRFDKGAIFHVKITSFLSDSLKDRERIPHMVFIEPHRIRCSALIIRTEGENPKGCHSSRWHSGRW